MAIVDTEISTFDTLRSDLEAEHIGEWVLIHDDALIGTFAALEEAARHAVSQFGRGPYLIRQVGAPPFCLPASVRYRLVR